MTALDKRERPVRVEPGRLHRALVGHERALMVPPSTSAKDLKSDITSTHLEHR